ncbi:class Ib ribonucleoside-diphosphate reductase assembly flavoprotein NrdI [Oenococcus sicerae]|uniref:class Ib ribonucleoside-diphosphate reductase assembly flavoprotein NrdI n=1 Tax=Oenococcus sicerae TaxID=2203724 RepID=UPI0010BB85F7|nr:Putative NrdI-like protein [Oenococcus sicerae]
MKKVRVLYISIEGNSRNFMKRLVAYAKEQNHQNPNNIEIEAVEISDSVDFAKEQQLFFVNVPTYLEGGTGDGPEIHEIFTNALGDYLDYQDNYKKMIGIFASGNRNFNVQFVLTAKRYAARYGKPLLYSYELSGIKQDVENFYAKIIDNIPKDA